MLRLLCELNLIAFATMVSALKSVYVGQFCHSTDRGRDACRPRRRGRLKSRARLTGRGRAPPLPGKSRASCAGRRHLVEPCAGRCCRRRARNALTMPVGDKGGRRQRWSNRSSICVMTKLPLIKIKHTKLKSTIQKI